MSTLTDREIEIAEYIAWGASVDEAADKLGRSPYTVKNTLRNIYAKLHFNKSTELAAYMFVKHPERMIIENDNPVYQLAIFIVYHLSTNPALVL